MHINDSAYERRLSVLMRSNTETPCFSRSLTFSPSPSLSFCSGQTQFPAPVSRKWDAVCFFITVCLRQVFLYYCLIYLRHSKNKGEVMLNETIEPISMQAINCNSVKVVLIRTLWLAILIAKAVSINVSSVICCFYASREKTYVAVKIMSNGWVE